MAFMDAPTPATSAEDRVPLLMYNAKAGRLFVADRQQDMNGEWKTNKTDVTMSQPAFAVDFGRLETGWAHFQEGQAPAWSVGPVGSPESRVDRPGPNYKPAWRVLVIGRDIGGVREFGGNSGVSINAMNELHTQFEASSEARAGKIPVVKMTGVLEIKAGQGSNFQPVFTVQQYVDRPAALGQRTVPPPGPKPPAQQQAESNAWSAHTKANGGNGNPRHVGAPPPAADDWGAGAPAGHPANAPPPSMDDLDDSIPF